MPRVTVSGFGPRQPSMRFTFAGQSVAAAAGETIAAALAAAGIATCRETRAGAPRGPFCGMGVCHECLVGADGETVRACTTPAREGMTAERHAPRAARRPEAAPQAALAPLVVDIAVVGAGPAGLSAALAAARCGLSVAMIDERKQPGGQYFKQPAEGFPVQADRLDRQFREGRRLSDAVVAAGVQTLSDTTIWSGGEGRELLASSPDGARRIVFERLVVATGAAERGVPFPGWTLPGVMTTGAAQTLLRGYGVAPGKRILIAGNGPLNLQLAAELVDAGATVVGLIEAARRPGIGDIPSIVCMSLWAPRLVADGLRYRARLKRAGVPLLHGAVVVSAEGDGRVAKVDVAPIDRDGRPNHALRRSFDADVLSLGYGFSPAIELAAAMGCELRFDARWRHLTLATGEDGRTSAPHVFAAGDGASFGGARVAMAGGTIAGLAAARDCGANVSGEQANELRAARGALARARRFQAALWELYDAPVLSHQLATPDTFVCRCEDVRRSDIETAIADGATGLGAVKRATRLGMGRCQGRYCAPVAAEMLAERWGRPPEAGDFFAPRTPVRPTSIATIAALDIAAPDEVATP